MRFSSDDTIKGDYDVVAKGASSLVAKEVRAKPSPIRCNVCSEQRAYIKWADLTEQMANTQDLAGIVMSKEEALQQQQSPEFQKQQQMQQMQMQLQLAQEQGKLAEIQARTGKPEAEALNRKPEAMYAAMQAAGIAVQQPGIAQAADLAMQSAGRDAAAAGIRGGTGSVCSTATAHAATCRRTKASARALKHRRSNCDPAHFLRRKRRPRST